MKEIRITPAVQRLLLLGFMGAVAAAVAAEAPEIRRYLNARAMG